MLCPLFSGKRIRTNQPTRRNARVIRFVLIMPLGHSAATNMHELTGDFFTVSQILGHSLKGTGIQLNLSSNLESVTAQYVNVRIDRKRLVLDTYHQAVLG